MLGKIINIDDNIANIKINKQNGPVDNLMSLHVIFEEDNKKTVGEVEYVDEEIIKVRFLGQIENNRFSIGVVRKPSMMSNVRIIKPEELNLLVGQKTDENLLIGVSPLYENCPIYVSINELFSNHMAIFGNTGSGKSCGFARFMQNLFMNQ